MLLRWTESLRVNQSYMNKLGALILRRMTDFPWAKLPQGTVVNDVGGGIGDVAMKLCKQHPNLVFKLQDLPERIHQAQNDVWPTKCPEAIARGRIEFKAFDMIREPPIPGCDIYFVSPHLCALHILLIRHPS